MTMEGKGPGVVEFTCQDTGRVLYVKKVPFTVTTVLHERYDEENPPPAIPTQKIDFGGGDIRDVENPIHPDYLRALGRHEEKKREWVNDKAEHLFAEIAIECDIDTEAVTKLRVAMKKFGIDLDPDDKYVYVWKICIGTGEGYQELFAAIQRRSQPTEPAIKAAVDRFQSEGKRS